MKEEQRNRADIISYLRLVFVKVPQQHASSWWGTDPLTWIATCYTYLALRLWYLSTQTQSFSPFPYAWFSSKQVVAHLFPIMYLKRRSDTGLCVRMCSLSNSKDKVCCTGSFFSRPLCEINRIRRCNGDTRYGRSLYNRIRLACLKENEMSTGVTLRSTGS